MTDGQARFHVNVDYRPSIVAPSGEKVADWGRIGHPSTLGND